MTGGAGFIGSNLVDHLMRREVKVRVFDNLSSGSKKNICQWLNNPRFKLVIGDLLNCREVEQAIEGCQGIWHLAAYPEVKSSSITPRIHFEKNIIATFNLLEAIRKSKTVQSLIFTSSSTVYGDAHEIPTPENYAPLKPISIYGATKLASEALISAYSYMYGFRAFVFRFANIIGARSRHGVIFDLVQKLKNNPYVLEILGDGTQAKSYMYVNECVESMLFASEKSDSKFETINSGSQDWIEVKSIARIIVEEMGLSNVEFRFTGGVDGGRGWKGDVKHMQLSIRRLESLGWKSKVNSEQSVRRTVHDILEDLS